MVGHVERVRNVMHAKLLLGNLKEGKNLADLSEEMILKRALRRRCVCFDLIQLLRMRFVGKNFEEGLYHRVSINHRHRRSRRDIRV